MIPRLRIIGNLGSCALRHWQTRSDSYSVFPFDYNASLMRTNVLSGIISIRTKEVRIDSNT